MQENGSQFKPRPDNCIRQTHFKLARQHALTELVIYIDNDFSPDGGGALKGGHNPSPLEQSFYTCQACSCFRTVHRPPILPTQIPRCQAF
jgi:hypothetical protein